MLVHWTRGQRTQPGKSPAQIGAIKRIPCPRLDQLPRDMLEYADRSFDRLSSTELKPACPAHVDPVRKEIDRIVLTMLGLDDERAMKAVDRLRTLWCHEPSVHGHKKAALRLLEDAA